MQLPFPMFAASHSGDSPDLDAPWTDYGFSLEEKWISQVHEEKGQQGEIVHTQNYSTIHSTTQVVCSGVYQTGC